MSKLIVKKFGGTSVANTERIEAVADIVEQTINEGNKVTVVLSAMGNNTDRLITLAKEINPEPDLREYDALVSTCLLYTSPSPRDRQKSRMPSSA